MRNFFSKLALAATLTVALAFTSCPERVNDDDGTGSSSSGGTTGGKQSSSSEITVNPSSSGKSSSSSGGAVSSSSGKSSSSGAVSSSSGRSSSSVAVSSSSSGGSSCSSSGGAVSADTSGTFKDSRDNQTYKWVKIGTQIWMAENLNYFEPWVGPTRGNKCYDNIDANCEKYGRLYEWDDAIRLCPDGWHLPTISEWNALLSYVGEKPGKKLKDFADWIDGNGTNDYGFKALPGGKLTDEYKEVYISGNWWTATENNEAASFRARIDGGDGVDIACAEPAGYSCAHYEKAIYKTYKYSIRCIKGYSSSSSITYGEVTDKRDNQKYRTVKIGTQNWMAQNLNYAGAYPEKGYCYNSKTDNCNKYGRLYDWVTAMDVSKDYSSSLLSDQFPVLGQHQGICPEGWHLPTISEWNALLSYVGEKPGKKLKARSSEWSDNYGTDKYGFGALPGGKLTDEYKEVYISGNWWTATENNEAASFRARMDGGDGVDITCAEPAGYSCAHYEKAIYKTYKYSIRCVED